MKLTKEMIDGMGGPQSNQWREFCRLCYTTFLLLRRHANLILNLFSLMVDASIPDIAMEPDKTVKKVQVSDEWSCAGCTNTVVNFSEPHSFILGTFSIGP